MINICFDYQFKFSNSNPTSTNIQSRFKHTEHTNHSWLRKIKGREDRIGPQCHFQNQNITQVKPDRFRIGTSWVELQSTNSNAKTQNMAWTGNLPNSNEHPKLESARKPKSHVWPYLRRAQTAARIVAADRISMNLGVSDRIYSEIKNNGGILGILDWSAKSICGKLIPTTAPSVNLDSDRILAGSLFQSKIDGFQSIFAPFSHCFGPLDPHLSRDLSLNSHYLSISPISGHCARVWI